MTPAERIAAAIRSEFINGVLVFSNAADASVDALCPKGESIRLDRTGDTDRLVRQFRIDLPVGLWANPRRPLQAWVDIEETQPTTQDGPDDRPMMTGLWPAPAGTATHALDEDGPDE